VKELLRRFTGETLTEVLGITDQFVMVDAVTVNTVSPHATGVKSLTGNEWYFSCHLIDEAVMPATLITEAMLQTLVCLLYVKNVGYSRRAFITDYRVNIRHFVKPGDSIDIRAEMTYSRRGVSKGVVLVYGMNNQVLASGSFKYVFPSEIIAPRGF